MNYAGNLSSIDSKSDLVFGLGRIGEWKHGTKSSRRYSCSPSI